MIFNTEPEKNKLFSEAPLIHIGYHKTATSWMQQELFTSSNEDFFHLTTRPKGASSLAMHFVYNDHQDLISPFKGASKKLEEELRSILKNKGGLNGKTPVISHERLSGNPHSGGFDSPLIAQRIYEYFPNAKILIIIREQKSWLLSNYFQYLTVGGNRKLTDYLITKYDGKIPCFSPYYVEFHRLIKYYQTLFGKDKVLVLPQEILKVCPDEFIKRLGSFVGRNIDTHSLCFDRRYNAQGHQYIQYQLRLLNALDKPSSVNGHFVYSNSTTRFIARGTKQVLKKLIPEVLNQKTTSKLKKEIELWSRDRYSESNRCTQELIGLDLSPFGYML